MVGGVCGVNAWCSRNIVILVDQEHCLWYIPGQAVIPVQDDPGMEIDCCSNRWMVHSYRS